jgi:hypothetical protein
LRSNWTELTPAKYAVNGILECGCKYKTLIVVANKTDKKYFIFFFFFINAFIVFILYILKKIVQDSTFKIHMESKIKYELEFPPIHRHHFYINIFPTPSGFVRNGLPTM